MIFPTIATLMTIKPVRTMGTLLIIIVVLAIAGGYALWNSGGFQFTAKLLLQTHDPQQGAICQELFPEAASRINQSSIPHVSNPRQIHAITRDGGELECLATVTVQTLFGQSEQRLTYHSPTGPSGLPKHNFELKRTSQHAGS